MDKHMRFKHPECSADDSVQDGSDQNISLQISSTPCNDVQEIEGTITRDDSSCTTKGESQHGSSNCKSYMIEFKKQTLDLLDSMSNTKNKWKKVPEAKQISNFLVINWNKARDKILAAVACKKRKANAGGVREARLRRKIFCEKARNSERYQLAVKLLLREFKLRQAKGSKISKLWIKSKMKKTIESWYGKGEADKFKASDNWFQ